MTDEFATLSQMLSPADREGLMELSRLCSKLPGDYLEVGSYVGYSARFILSQMPVEKLLFCLDYFETRKLAAFRQNIEEYGLHRVVDIAGDFRNCQFDRFRRFAFGFIDHDHSAESTEKAWWMFWPLISSGGLLAFHDYGHPDYGAATEFLNRITHEKLRRGGIIAFKKV